MLLNSACGRECLSTERPLSLALSLADRLTHTHTHTQSHTYPFNDPLSGTTQVSRYQKRKTNLDFTGARDSEWQWHQLGHMQVCTSLQTDNHVSTSLLKFFTGRMPFLPPNQQRQSTEGKADRLSGSEYEEAQRRMRCVAACASQCRRMSAAACDDTRQSDHPQKSVSARPLPLNGRRFSDWGLRPPDHPRFSGGEDWGKVAL